MYIYTYIYKYTYKYTYSYMYIHKYIYLYTRHFFTKDLELEGLVLPLYTTMQLMYRALHIRHMYLCEIWVMSHIRCRCMCIYMYLFLYVYGCMSRYRYRVSLQLIYTVFFEEKPSKLGSLLHVYIYIHTGIYVYIHT